MGDIGNQGADLVLLFPHVARRQSAGRQIARQPTLQRRESALVKRLFGKGPVNGGSEHIVQPPDGAGGPPAVIDNHGQGQQHRRFYGNPSAHGFTAQV